jgi:hypothetical protein
MWARACLTATIVLTTLVGCVTLPMQRTYYEPNPADGKPIRSSACGWNATALDGLQREIDGISLSVFPTYDAGRLSVYVLFRRSTKTVDLDPDKLEVRFDDDAAGVGPEKTTVKAAGPYFFKSIDYVFSPSFDANAIAVTFLPGFMKVDGKVAEVTQFRFLRVSKWDVYASSINC